MKKLKTLIEDEEVEVSIERKIATIEESQIEFLSSDKLGDKISINGEEILVDDVVKLDETDLYRVEISGYTIDVKVLDPINEALSSRGGVSGDIISPMSGTISGINVEIGQEVEEGQLLLVISAMKMENQINAPIGGFVRDIKVNIDEQVPSGKLLVTVEPKE